TESPEALTNKISFPVSVHAGNVDSTLALDKSRPLGTPRISAGSRSTCARGPAADGPPRSDTPSALLTYGTLPQDAADLPKYCLPPALGNEHDVVFALPLGGT